MPQPFFDTNVLIYAVSAETGKADRASSLLAAGGVISVQVLNEAARVLRKKQNQGWPEVRAFLANITALVEVTPLDIETHRIGLDIAQNHQIAVFDAMIVAAALQAGCGILYSEDMHRGLVVEGRLRIENPFRE